MFTTAKQIICASSQLINYQHYYVPVYHQNELSLKKVSISISIYFILLTTTCIGYILHILY